MEVYPYCDRPGMAICVVMADRRTAVDGRCAALKSSDVGRASIRINANSNRAVCARPIRPSVLQAVSHRLRYVTGNGGDGVAFMDKFPITKSQIDALRCLSGHANMDRAGDLPLKIWGIQAWIGATSDPR
jgi:hypothetical protein